MNLALLTPDKIRKAETDSAITTVLMVGFLCFVAILVTLFVWIGTSNEACLWVICGEVGIYCTSSVCILVESHYAGRSRAFGVGVPKPLESKVEVPALPTPSLPALSAPVENPIKATLASGREVEVARNLWHGFEPDDLLYLCQYLADGNKWTESVMERLRLPVSRELIGKAQGDTYYQRSFGVPDGVFLRAGVITGRGGKGNPSGTLALADYTDIVKAVKNVAE